MSAIDCRHVGVTFRGYNNPGFKALQGMLNETEGFGFRRGLNGDQIRQANSTAQQLMRLLNAEKFFNIGGAGQMQGNYDPYLGILKVLP